MLEDDIKALYERMATADQPPSKISIPGAGRTGRARLNRRRASAAAPLLAAVAVIAIALTGAIPGGTRGNPPASGTQRAPRNFSVLVPYARFGWLPGKAQPSDQLSQTAELIATGGDTDLSVQAEGTCRVARHALTCPSDPGVTPVALGRPVAEIDGHPAYWDASPGYGQNFGALAWQYANGGWAVLSATTERLGVKIADHVRFGYAGEPGIRFGVQLRDVPADWQVNWVETLTLHGIMYASSYGITAGHVRTNPIFPVHSPTMYVGPHMGGLCRRGIVDHSKHEVINGYKVVVGTSEVMQGPALCASDAAGSSVSIFTRPHPTLSPVSIFAHHLRLLGSNPANWTTKPISN